MEVRTLNKPLSEVQADVLVLPICEGAVHLAAADLQSVIAQAHDDFTGEFGQTLVIYTAGKIAARKLLAVGLGKEEKVDLRKLRRAAGMAARAARDSGAPTVAFALPAVGGLQPGKAAQFLVEGALHGLHRFESYKSEQEDKPQVGALVIVGGPEVEEGAYYGRVVGEATNLTRSINWMPGNYLHARKLAETAQAICAEVGIEIEVYDKKGCEELGLGLLLAVNQGSAEEPRFIVMRYKGNGGKGPWLGIVGKGLTFDSGGVSIKPSDNMWDMKYDMSGGGAVLGAVKAIGQLKPKADILFVVPATDNMPDGGAYKPGDVISGLSGKTVEVRSTDAEGRLILADGLAYAVKQGCANLIEASTLTGAAQIALGPIRMGIVSNNDAWEDEVFAAIEEAGERGWKLPHDPEYHELFKSPIADMSNTGTARAAGTTVGGLFLMSHVGDVPCVHLDIAAQAWKGSTDKYEDEGATGVAVKSFVRAAMRFAEGNA
ncbi:MAG TPA: leucyl aminopeptidase [Symbiobacteriaceae bacterium]|nr:leucyl aminopeptidase [Symbiobacteriaceae bacterium]